MKFSNLFTALIAIFLVACGQKTAEAPAAKTPAPQTPAAQAPAAQAPAAAPQASLPPGHPPVDAGKMAQAAQGPSLTQKGQVVSTIEVPQYTYIEVVQDNKTYWLAAPSVAVKKGDTIQFDDGAVMTNFISKSLNRTFPSITFVSRVVVANGKT